ncbi:MAG TPA: hypothetical protein PKJ97_03070 [Candidatus Bilamarchaeaceae archaeon]|nr:hypothetical protein [Candidatus Bilamarchaeaceae archaeon]
MSHLRLIKHPATENVGASPANRPAKEVGAFYFALRKQPCMFGDVQRVVELEKERRQLLSEFRDSIARGDAKERTEAINEIAELAGKGELRPFIELAVRISFCILGETSNGEKKAILELVSTVSAVPEEQLKRSGFEDGVRGNLLDLAIRFQDFLFREDFFKNSETRLFESSARQLIKINPRRALNILLNQLNALNYECRGLLSSQEIATRLDGPEMRRKAEILDAFTSIAEGLVDVSQSFSDAVKREGEAFRTEAGKMAEIAEEANKTNPMARIVQLSLMARLVGEACSSLGKLDMLEAREIRDALSGARALMKELGA